MQHTKAQYLLAQYKNQLDDFFANNTEANTALCQQLEQNFTTDQLKELLSALLQDTKTLAEVASRSYQHGNGFF